MSSKPPIWKVLRMLKIKPEGIAPIRAKKILQQQVL